MPVTRAVLALPDFQPEQEKAQSLHQHLEAQKREEDDPRVEVPLHQSQQTLAP